MFWFCKPKPLNVYFYTSREPVFNFSRPQSGIKFIPTWMRQLPAPHFPDNISEKLVLKTNIKSCPGVFELYKSSFVFQMWSDLNVEVYPDKNYRYQFIDNQSEIKSHPNWQFAGSYFDANHINIKLINPWHTKTDKNVKLLVLPPVWNNFGHEDVLLPPGISRMHTSPLEFNLNLLIKVKPEKTVYEFLFGQPIAHVIPLTERPVKYHYELVSEQELVKMKSRNPMFFMSRNRYRRAEKLCSHA